MTDMEKAPYTETVELHINGLEYTAVKGRNYIRFTSMDLPYVIIRAKDSGVFAGYLQEKDGQQVTLKYARRLWYWSGAASCSELANKGVKDPANCKFPPPVNIEEILDTCEIIYATNEGRRSIEGVTHWTAFSEE
jgi:hypothetical protein